jgi:acyl-CoA synthetase (NDP forming)
MRSAVLSEVGSGKKVASHSLTRRLLATYGVRVAEECLVADADAAVRYADKIGYPVVVKLAKSDALTHMTEVGGVRTNLRDRSEVAQAVREVQKRSAETGGDARAEVVVQQMVGDATEIYLGGSNPGYGYPPAVLVGLGGIFLEATRDVAMSLAPIDAAEARRMIERLRSHKILNGFRGRPAADVAAIVDAITRLSDLVLDLAPFFDELDINPAMVFGERKGIRVVDALLTYRQASMPVPTVEPTEVTTAEKIAT